MKKINISKKQIKKTLPKVKVGLDKYLWLQKEFINRDASKDEEFQRKFNGFYRVRRNKKWQKCFYKLLEENKNNCDEFDNILRKLHKQTKMIEASFVSKLIATINPQMPVIDKLVFNNLGLKLPSANNPNRIAIINNLYQSLTKELNCYLDTDRGEFLVSQFRSYYPNAKISRLKMLDFVLWQIRG